MKRILLLQLFLFTAFGFAQVGVNTTTPDPSSMLDVTSTNKGALFPRVSLSNINVTTLDGTNPAATGLLIWNTNAATIGGNGVGYYYFNGTIWISVLQAATSDHDWYEIGTTTAPNSIVDNMFHTGNVVIGKNTITADNPKLSIEESGPGSIFPLKIVNIKDSSTSTLQHTGINLEMEATSTANEYGIAVSHNNPNASLKYGVLSTVENGSGTNSAFQGRVTGSGLNVGNSTIIFDSGSASTSEQRGYTVDLQQPTTSTTIGIRNRFLTNNLALDSGTKYGVLNVFGSSTRNVGGELYGSHTTFDSSLTSATNKYGSYTIIPSTLGGIHYGIYSDATKANSFAGYFLGRMSIGTTPFNTYILPSSRGTANQIMQTDGVGNVSWVTPTSSSDHDIYEVGGTNAPNAITDNKYTQGSLSIGSTTAATGVVDIETSTRSTNLDITNTFATNPTGINIDINSSSNNKSGIRISQSGTSVGVGGTSSTIYSLDNTIGDYNRDGLTQAFAGESTNPAVSYTGIRNVFSANNFVGNMAGILNFDLSTSNGTRNGLVNTFAGTGNGQHVGVNNNFSGTGTGDKYGVLNNFPTTAGGTHYGIFSNVLKSGSFAGYFLGNVSIGTLTTNNYILPPSRGTNGQIMQTDGTGNVSWINPSLVDNQQIDLLTLTGDTLNISLQDDGAAAQTLNLAAIDNQATDVFSLTGTTLNLSLQNDGTATQTVDLSSLDTDDQATDLFSLTGTTLNLSLQNDGVATQTVDLSSLKDADWFEVGGTNSPDAITDNKFTLGDISIGKITAANGKLDVDAAVKNVTASFTNNNTSTGSKWGIQNNVTVEPTNTLSYGISNSISGNANFKYGILNSLSGSVTGSAFEYGLVNSHLSGGAVDSYGVFNSFNPSALHSGFYYGMYNQVSVPNHTGGFIGVSNIASHATNNVVFGISNSLSGSGSGARIGVRNTLTGTSTNEVTGIDTEILASGTGDKYGERILISNISGGTHYGVYSEVTKANSYAGYFLGNVSVGTTTANNYILPASRGTNGQIMQTDGAGNVTWINPPTDTDDQGTDVFSLTGNTLNLSLQNDGVATQTVDLSSLAGDDDWTDVGTDIERQAGNVYIGDTAVTNNNLYISNQIIDWDNPLYYIDPDNISIVDEIEFDDGSVADPSIRFFDINTGFFSPITATTAYSANGIEAFRIHPSGDIAIGQTIDPDFKLSTSSLFGNSNVRIGNNDINDNVIEVDHSGQLGNGLEVNMNSIYTLASRSAISANSTGRVINVDLSRYETGSPSNLFGVKSIVTDDITGVEYGVYSEALQANGFAGYFLGRMSIGTTTANNYILPASRGTNGQIMQTNATGVVTWVNPVVDTDTDNQQIDILSLTGDILNISLQDDAVATQTVNLSALDNQTTDVFSLTGNTLNLSLQNDGVATQTVDLSPLSNDWKLTGNAGTVAGTNFIGTTDAQDLDFRTNNVTKLTLTQRGQLSITNTGGSVMIGSGAGDNDDFTVNQNTFVGTVSGQNTSNGNLNSGFGFNTLNDNTLGLGNTAVGANALNVNVDGNNNTGLGRGANVSTTNLTNATAVGFNSTVNAANKIRLGNAAITVVEGQVAYTNPSDARFKFNIQENVPGLDFIKKLKPVTYNFDTKKFDEHLNQNRNKEEVVTEDFTTSTAIIRTGFLAQDVEKICADLGYNFDGLHVPDANNPTDNYGIAYSQFIMPIVKAVQEQQVIIETQKTELEQLKSELEKYKTLEERIKALEQK